jgi:hypothetical protein
MKLGGENKNQLIILGVMLVVLAYFFYSNVLSTPSAPSSAPRRPSAAASNPVPGGDSQPSVVPAPGRRAANRERSEEFHPVFLALNPTKRRDPKTIDPTLLLDRLAKVQSVDIAGGSRNLFQFSTAPPTKADPATLTAKGPEPKVYVAQGPRQPPPPQPPPPPPPPPPITLKFYGFSTPQDNGKRTAYLLDGEEIYLVAEGDTVKRRYKILRIQANSVLIEDLDAKRQQSVPMVEEGPG